MKTAQIPNTPLETQYVKFFGGLDLASPVLSIKPGSALDAVNYEAGLLGGYKRIDGFERIDGRPAPSAATYLYLEGVLAAPIVLGSIITGATSGATGVAVVVDVALGAVCVSKVVGAFVRGENIKVGGAVVGHILVDPSPRGYRDAKNDAIALAAAADLYRADIGAVPGQGPVRGVWMYAGVLYAFRDKVGGLSCGMYKVTPAGWVPVAMGRELQVKQPSKAVTVAAAVITWPAHGLVTGTKVQLSGTMPLNVAPGTTYYVVLPQINTFQLSDVPNGNPVGLGNIPEGLICLPQAQRVNEGDTITGETSGATALVKRVGVRTGDWSSYGATATMALDNVAGAFQAGEVLKVAGVPKMSTVAPDSAITLQPGGRFEFVNNNFSGSSSMRRMYGCDGVNPAFEFDGSVFVPIRTGMAVDAPRFIAAHKTKLFLAFKGSLQYSGDGQPYAWTILTGANEIAIGDDITGMARQAGNTLAIFARNSSYQLNGSTNNTFQMDDISAEVGGLPYTVQVVGKTYALDDRGIVETTRTQAYGNFDQATISDPVQKLLEKFRPRVIGSVVYRNRSQYRLYSSDGTGLIATFSPAGLVGITKLRYPFPPTCLASCEDAAGTNVVFFGADNGYVYQADMGSSFDGAPIEAYLRMPFNNISSPRLRKRFRKAVMEMSSTAYAAIRFQPEFDYGNAEVGTHRTQTGESTGSGGYWDLDNWDDFFYDDQLVSTPEFSIEGTGLNMALVFYSSSTIDLGHVLQGMLIHFSIRRLSR